VKLSLPYGKAEQMTVRLPDHRVAGVIGPNEVPIGDEPEVLRAALSRPIHAPPLGRFMAGASEVLFLVNDATRPTPTARVLDVIEPDLEGVRARFLVATGIHRAPTEEEYRHIFGRHYDRLRGQVLAHDARRDEVVALGASRAGTTMEVNRLAAEAERIVIIGSVEPHYFAGYTGGRKSFLPGVASYATIEQNHRLAMRKEARALALEGNPVHEDMMDALGSVRKDIFSIQTVLDKRHRIYAAFAGHIHDSFLAATEAAKRVFAAPVPERADIVVSVVQYPQDVDLYQAQKGIENGKLALREGGILILLAKCRMGMGEAAFAELLGASDNPPHALDRIGSRYRLGFHKAAKMAECALGAQMWAVTSLPPALLPPLFLRPFQSLQAALDAALVEKGPEAKVLFLTDGGMAVPLVD
jgi:nickel-dependent lactate racemase